MLTKTVPTETNLDSEGLAVKDLINKQEMK